MIHTHTYTHVYAYIPTLSVIINKNCTSIFSAGATSNIFGTISAFSNSVLVSLAVIM